MMHQPPDASNTGNSTTLLPRLASGHALLEEGALLVLKKRRRGLAGQDGLRRDQALDLSLPLGAAVVEGALDPGAVRLDGVELHLLLHHHGLGVRLHARGVLVLLVGVRLLHLLVGLSVRLYTR